MSGPPLQEFADQRWAVGVSGNKWDYFPEKRYVLAAGFREAWRWSTEDGKWDRVTFSEDSMEAQSNRLDPDELFVVSTVSRKTIAGDLGAVMEGSIEPDSPRLTDRFCRLAASRLHDVADQTHGLNSSCVEEAEQEMWADLVDELPDPPARLALEKRFETHDVAFGYQQGVQSTLDFLPDGVERFTTLEEDSHGGVKGERGVVTDYVVRVFEKK